MFCSLNRLIGSVLAQKSAFPVARFTLWLPEEFDRVDLEHVSELLEHVDGCGFLAFEHPDVVAVDADPGRDFLL